MTKYRVTFTGLDNNRYRLSEVYATKTEAKAEADKFPSCLSPKVEPDAPTFS